MEIVQERLEREFALNLIVTVPTVIYKAYLHSGKEVLVDNPSLMPDRGSVQRLEEPFLNISLHSPSSCLGSLMKLCENKRGASKPVWEYIASDRAILKYKLPLSEMIVDFHDRLKSLSKGYASMEYEFSGYEESPLVKIDILLNGDPVDAPFACGAPGQGGEAGPHSD